MKHETSIALYDYWLSRHGETAVRAAGIRPDDLAPLLPFLFLFEFDANDFFRFRYCGAGIAIRYGRDLTDENFLQLWSPSDRESLRHGLRAHEFRSTGTITGLLAETMGGGIISYEMLLLPLAGDTRPAGAIGSMVRTGGHEELNRIRARIVGQSLQSFRYLPSVGPRPLTDPHLTGATVVAVADLQARRRYGHLTVLNGGK